MLNLIIGAAYVHRLAIHLMFLPVTFLTTTTTVMHHTTSRAFFACDMCAHDAVHILCPLLPFFSDLLFNLLDAAGWNVCRKIKNQVSLFVEWFRAAMIVAVTAPDDEGYPEERVRISHAFEACSTSRRLHPFALTAFVVHEGIVVRWISVGHGPTKVILQIGKNAVEIVWIPC
jgi:hypothetical protein